MRKSLDGAGRGEYDRKNASGVRALETRTVDLYEHFGAAGRGGPGGRLTVWTTRTPAGVSTQRRRPGVLILPGGGYEHISQRESEPVALRFAARGWVPFVLEYSVAPARFPVQLREAALAMRYIRENAGEFEIDPGAVAAVGFSAGGHLCGTLGTLFDSAEVSDIAPAPVLRPDALGLCYSVAVSWGETHTASFENLTGGDGELARRLSLDGLVRSDMPPVFLWGTRDDGSVPCRNSILLAEALDKAGVDFAFHLYRHGKHGLSTADAMAFPAHDLPRVSWDVPGWVEAMVAFFAESGLVIRDEG